MTHTPKPETYATEIVERGRLLSKVSTRKVLIWAMLAALLVYWPGLKGPLLFDDYWNLTPIFQWRAGTVHPLLALLPNADSFIFSRPIATASFMASVWLGGLESTFPLKLGNLAVHLACGVAATLFLHKLIKLDPWLNRLTMPLAGILIATWLLHPLHVSTVLYVVQRMAQLSALFCLLSLLAYLAGRRHLQSGNRVKSFWLLFGAFPALAALGLLSKQNAAIAPFLCLIIEIFYFPNRGKAEARAVAAFFSIFALAPAIASVTLLALKPDALLAAYVDIEFGLAERLLTQPRVLLEYLGMWLVPRSAEMGLYTDDFVVSTSLWQPNTTAIAIAVLTVVTAGALAIRKLAPSVTVGWLFFLTAHMVESSFLPLEMYYEHRNYLPSVGLLLAAAGLLELAVRKSWTREKVRVASFLVAASLIGLSFATLGRVLVWQNERTMIAQGLQHHPNSIRLRIDGTALAMREGDYEEAVRILEPMLSHPDARHRWIGRLEIQAAKCASGKAVEPEQFSLAKTETFPVITVSEVSVAMFLERVTRHGECAGVGSALVADTLESAFDAAVEQPNSSNNKSTFQRLIAQLYARGGDWPKAEKHAEEVWENTESLSSGSMLARAYIRNGKLDQAEGVILRLSTLIRPMELPWVREVENLGEMLKAERSRSPIAPE